MVIDDSTNNTPSKTAAGLINPVTGRRVVTVWMDEIIIPFAEHAYNELGSFLTIQAITKSEIIDFFPNPFMKESFLKKINQGASYISQIDDEHYLKDYFNYEFGAGFIKPAYYVHLPAILSAWQNFLMTENKILNTAFDFSKLNITKDKITYKTIEADRIIFCDGVQCKHNPYFSLLPFALNKGEAIIIEASDLPNSQIYKKAITLVPYQEKGFFWAGTNYIWDFDDDQPTEIYRHTTTETLKHWLKVPFKIVDHKAAVRPATVERRPFVGFHPLYKNLGILNGMGTKGCSLAPYFAHQLVQNILHNFPIEKEADISRHTGILSRKAV